MRFNARLDTSEHGPSIPLKEGWADADSLRGINNAMVKYPLVVSSSCTKSFYVSPQVKIQRTEIWKGCRLSVMIGGVRNISLSATKLYRSTIINVPHLGFN
jgi:hypothetical protein